MLNLRKLNSIVGTYAYWQQLVLYLFAATFFLSEIWSQGWQNALIAYTLPRDPPGFHAVTGFMLVILAMYLRWRLPKTVKGCFYSLTAAMFCPLIAETFLGPWFKFFFPEVPLWKIFCFWLVCYLGVVTFWLIVLASRTYRLFSLKRLMIGIGVMTFVFIIWITVFGFHQTGCVCSYGHMYDYDPATNFIEIAWYAVWIPMYAWAFKGLPK